MTFQRSREAHRPPDSSGLKNYFGCGGGGCGGQVLGPLIEIHFHFFAPSLPTTSTRSQEGPDTPSPGLSGGQTVPGGGGHIVLGGSGGQTDAGGVGGIGSVIGWLGAVPSGGSTIGFAGLAGDPGGIGGISMG
jgi:hypothetical protein